MKVLFRKSFVAPLPCFSPLQCLVGPDIYCITVLSVVRYQYVLLMNNFFVYNSFHDRSMTEKLCGLLPHWQVTNRQNGPR